MPASGWLAVGGVAAALLGMTPILAPIATALVAAAIAIGGASLRPVRRPFRSLALVGVGGVLLALRIAESAPAPVESGPLAPGDGPWAAVVETVSPARDGSQVATLRIEPGGIRVAATLPRYPPIEPGIGVTVEGTLRPPPDDPYGTYLARIGVQATIRSRSLEVRPTDVDAAVMLERLRRGAGTALTNAIPEPEAGLASGIVVGLRDRVDRDLAADFTTVGASHVVAISGWNIAIVAATVAALLRSLPRRRRSVVTLLAIVAYVLFAGASASVVRAAVMAGVVIGARESGRAGRAAAALGWAAFGLLLLDPRLVGDAGFQLSSLATAGILAWASPLTSRLRALLPGRLPASIVECLAVSLAAQVATLPVVLLTFGRLAIISPLLNLLVVPLVAPAMAASAVALLGGATAMAGLPAVVATIVGLPAWLLLSLMVAIVHAGAALPFASAALDPPWNIAGATIAAVAPFAVGAWVRRRRASGSPRAIGIRAARPAVAIAASRSRSTGRPGPSRFVTVALALSVAALGVAAIHRPDGATRITVLDVGQGDAILVEGDRGGRLLVDGGPDPDRLLIELDERLPPWDRRLDAVILTHPHEDHVAGLALLLARYRVGRVYEPGMRGPGPGYAAWDEALAAAGAPSRGRLATGDRLAVDDLRFDVLWPDPGRVPSEPPDGGRGINDVSIVLLGEVDGRRVLLTGDVEDDVDPILAKRGLPPIDLLKVAHHGSGTASTVAFLGVVRPSVAVVSSGAGNPYGHPAKTTLQHLAETGARVLRTDTDGTVEVAIADGVMTVRSSGVSAATGIRSVGRALADRSPTGPPSDPFSCAVPSSG
jgi:competence protein ComEC